MYHVSIKGDKLYHTRPKGYGELVELFGVTEQGETLMSLVNVALGSCVTMCVQGYLAKYQGQKEVAITVDS